MNTFLKTKRELAGLTQEQLAEKMKVSVQSVQNWESGKTEIYQERYRLLSEVLNVPEDLLIKELQIKMDNKRKNLDNWPDFLFDDETNRIIDSLHLNNAQQDLFGLLYIYCSEYIKDDEFDHDGWNDELKKIPFGFIDRVGSIQFMNQAEGLYQVMKYIKADYLLDKLKLNPDMEFNIRRLSKDQICEFIENGYIESDDLILRMSMKKARIMLPILKENGPVHLTDGKWANPVREDIPKAVYLGILEMCDLNEDSHKKGRYKELYNTSYILNGLEEVTDFYEDDEHRWKWRINKKGEKLLEWFQGE